MASKAKRAGRGGRGVRQEPPRPQSMALWLVDGWFRGWGFGAIAALVGTLAMLVLQMPEWRVPFVIAHLAALLAVAPLGVVLVAQTFARYRRESGSVAGGLRGLFTHDRLVTALVLASFVTAAVSLSQFQGGIRWLRALANYSTVAIVVTLVWRYLRGARRRG
ncbi:MAG: hypothetical protein WC211_02380 [Dehalococcoidia bacterium]